MPRCKKSGKKKIQRWQANLMLRKPGAPRVYRCTACGFWHITSRQVGTFKGRLGGDA